MISGLVEYAWHERVDMHIVVATPSGDLMLGRAWAWLQSERLSDWILLTIGWLLYGLREEDFEGTGLEDDPT
jgi:hypothetical protein